jgi:uroporphyrin-III C-methyltransferase/precorrin-2 dehydrogenase/sirohydrochlorin ferrochelatase
LPHHPVFLDLAGRVVLIVGGGAIAVEKVNSLLHSGASIRIVSPVACPEVVDWAFQGVLVWEPRPFEDDDVLAAFMVIAATDDPLLNAHVFQVAESHLKLANSVDDPVNCNFIMAAIARSGPMQVAVSSAGCSPALAQRVRERIGREMLTAELGELAEFLGARRPLIKGALATYQARQRFWEDVIDSNVPAILAAEGTEAANVRFLEILARHQGAPAQLVEEPRLGKVTLVGAGPGDPDLLTIKGLKALEAADVILYDRLVNPALLKLARPGALLVDVGKAPGDKGQPRQETIHALLIEHAKRGRTVVRLKGGDPFVFGRGGEEVLALREAGIPVEVIPGITSAIAAPAAAGIPVTHRNLSSGFAVFTAQGASSADTVPWEAAAQIPTLVLLMGVERLPHIVARLLEQGKEPSTPVAVISRGTCDGQQVAVGTLETIEALAAHLPSPATIVVGDVVSLAATGKSTEFLTQISASSVS